MKTALITGITGQNGHYLSRLLQSKGYRVVGAVPPALGPVDSETLELPSAVALRPCDVTDSLTVSSIVAELRPDEVYHLAALSDVASCTHQPALGFETNCLGTLHILEAIKRHSRGSRFVLGSSGAIFGYADPPQDESTPFEAVNLYGVTKLSAHVTTRVYRENDGLFACSAILFNHESPRRPATFVTRKISRGVAAILRGESHELTLGNLDAQRDWGFAPDYVQAMWLMLQHREPQDFVVATGVGHTVRDFAREAFASVGLDWQDYVRLDESLLRPADRERLQGNPARAERVLGWTRTVGFSELAKLMVEADAQRARVDSEPTTSIGLTGRLSSDRSSR